MKKNLANIITGSRVICSLMILFFPALSVWYYALYIYGGLTDVLDGAVARGLKIESEFGDKFDTIADITFSMAVFLRLVDLIIVPTWMITWICAIILIKFSTIIVSLTVLHRFITVHSVLNKICGFYVYFMLFSLGLGIHWQIKFVLVIAACIIATVAAVHEAYCIFIGGPGNIDEAMDRVERMEMILDKLNQLIYEAESEEITDDLIEVMASEEKICKYLDLPIQHASDEILKRMGRKTSKKSIEIPMETEHIQQSSADAILHLI